MNNKTYIEDIIIARATPPGQSAIAVIRVSGKNSWKILKNIFLSDKKDILFKSYNAYYGKIMNKNKIVDYAIIITYRENKSFTGEESFEINCHGSDIIVSLIIKLIISNGARIAEPGEFSKRAFLNGKMDLTEAEAIMDIVKSSTINSSLIALQQLTGRVTTEINKIKKEISRILAEIEVNIDYPEEDLSLDTENWIHKINEIINLLDSLLKGFIRGHFYREGIFAVILGKTNSGKSTLFNFLLNDDKAIVSDIHGTTRDYLDGVINIKGFGVRIYDTAGLRDSKDKIEIEGVKRAFELTKKVNIIIYLLSTEDGFTSDDKNNINIIIENSKNILLVLNKIDLIDDEKCDFIISELNEYLKTKRNNFFIVKMSALNKTGIEDFNNFFIKLIIGENYCESEDPVITNSRHADLLEKAKENLTIAIKKINEGLLDLTAFEIRESLDRLGEITGEVTREDILEQIFSNFCIGK
jgi:tRNA modification GTPase